MWLPAIAAGAYFLGVLSMLALFAWVGPSIFMDDSE
jgi:hypothetical protein